MTCIVRIARDRRNNNNIKCDKLPTTKKEIVQQLKKNKVIGFKDTALFLTGVGKQGQWNEQKVTMVYMMKIRPYIIEILDDLSEKGI